MRRGQRNRLLTSSLRPWLSKTHPSAVVGRSLWLAGELRGIDIAKGGTRFCNILRMEPETGKLFERLRKAQGYEGFVRVGRVGLVAQLFVDLNVIQPFHEGNGRAQRVLFEHIIINASHLISWWAAEPGEWVQANMDAVLCDDLALESSFERCIGKGIEA